MFPVSPSQTGHYYIVYTSPYIQLMLTTSHRKLFGTSNCKDFNSFPLQFCKDYHSFSSELAYVKEKSVLSEETEVFIPW